eukprot:scaffold134997_cov18-Tisochrysis_lutea.AAC.3
MEKGSVQKGVGAMECWRCISSSSFRASPSSNSSRNSVSSASLSSSSSPNGCSQLKWTCMSFKAWRRAPQ